MSDEDANKRRLLIEGDGPGDERSNHTTMSGDSTLFASVKFYVTGTLDDKILKTLEKGGATRRKFLEDFVTHVICGKDHDETQVAEAQDLYDLPAVDERWVLACTKLNRLANTKAYEQLPNKLFSNLIFAVSSGLAPNDNKSLYATIRFHGGALERNYTERTSILICPSASGAAYAKAVAVGNDRTKIVTPDWVLDCVQEKRLVDTQNYHPRLLVVSSMVIERKIIQVGLVQDQSDTNNTTPPKVAIVDAEKKPQLTLKNTVIPTQGGTTIGAMIRPIKTQTSTGTAIITNSPAKNNLIIQQQNTTATLNVRPAATPTTPTRQTAVVDNTAQVTPVKTEATELQTTPTVTQTPATTVPVSPITGHTNVAPPANTTAPSSNVNTGTPTMINVQQQQHQPLPQGQQLKITQQTITADSLSKGAALNTTTAPSNTTTIPKAQIVNTKQIQFIQNPNNNGPAAPNQGPTKATMIVQTSASTGQIISQQTAVGGQQQQQQLVQQQSQSGNTGQPPQQYQKHIILSQQELAQLQQQQTSTGQAPGQNIVIIQQQGVEKLNQPPGTPVQVGQTSMQSQSVPQSPVQAPQFSNVQFIRSNSQPVGSSGTPVMTAGGAMVTPPQGQPIQLQQVRLQQGQQGAGPTGQVVTIHQQLPQQQQGHGQSPQQQGQVQGQPMIISQQGQVQQWTTTTTNNPQQGGQPGQQTIQVQPQQQQGGPQQQQFIRAVGGVVRGPGPQQMQQQQWQQGGPVPQQQQQQGMAQRQLIQLDPQTHSQWQMMDPAKKAEYIAKLQSRRNIMLQRQPVYQGRPGAPAGVVTTTRMTANGQQQQNIVFRGQWVPQQQQQQGGPQQPQLQQQQRQQILVRSNAPGLSPIQGQMVPGGPTGIVTGGQVVGHSVTPGGSNAPQIMNSMPVGIPGVIPGGVQQPGQMPVQMDPSGVQGVQGQPRPQFQRMTSLPGQKIIQTQQQYNGQTIQTTRFVTIDGAQVQPGPGSVDGANQPQMISKTKTALANMLNSRMTSGNNGGPPMDVEPSAAGTLRLMTAHHLMNQSMAGHPRTPQELLALQQQQQQQQQRRTLGNITNASGAGGSAPGGVGGGVIHPGGPSVGIGGPVVATPPAHMSMVQAQQQQQQQHNHQQGPGGVMKVAPYSPGRAPQPRPQFYGHNPNLPKLPTELFLLGCNFFIVEYDETHAEDLVVWKELMRKHGGEIETFYCPRVTHVLCRSQRHGVVMQAIRDGKRCVSAHWLNDAIVKKQLLPPWEALHLPAPSTFGRQRPATRHIVSISGFEGDERQRVKKMVEETGARMTTYFSKQNTVLVCKRLDGMKYKRAKDWGVPVVNATWLSDILMGNLSTMSNFETAKYQQYNLNCPFRIEYGLVPHLMTSWKSPINLNQESHERLKRCHAEPVPGPKPKKPLRSTPLPLPLIPEVIKVIRTTENAPRVIFSKAEDVEGLTRAVTAFGGVVVVDPADATHLVMTKLERTCKLLQCLCTVNYILSSDWLVDSVAAGELLPEEKYPLQDTSFERDFKCNLQAVIKSNSRRTLFEGRTFYMTPSVKPGLKVLSRLIELSGGRVEKSRRSLLKIHEANAQSPNSYVVLSCSGDLHLLADILRSKQHNRIVSTTEFIMESIMTQKFRDMEPHVISCV